jgi:aspartyl-tRNA(Asn)/glutamyl-tRNA(Gln) amidotransferase subunit A
MPTGPCVAPTIAEASATDEAYFRWNTRLLRNCGLINFLDGCAATVPCHAPGAAPVGLMVCGTALRDRHILAVANAIEGALARHH